MQSIPTGYTDLFHSNDVNYSEQWNATTWHAYRWEYPHTGHLTGINYWIYSTSVSQSAVLKTSLFQNHVSTYPPIILWPWSL
jgi:hypothetical protein